MYILSGRMVCILTWIQNRITSTESFRISLGCQRWISNIITYASPSRRRVVIGRQLSSQKLKFPQGMWTEMFQAGVLLIGLPSLFSSSVCLWIQRTQGPRGWQQQCDRRCLCWWINHLEKSCWLFSNTCIGPPHEWSMSGILSHLNFGVYLL